ncbi:MAG: hypothetical protein IPM84_06475 [Anaerolineae bacterium]|nr:hypothetical protein [Anaerolineae bacterium]
MKFLHRRFVIATHGRPMAVMVNIEDWERLSGETLVDKAEEGRSLQRSLMADGISLVKIGYKPVTTEMKATEVRKRTKTVLVNLH